MSKLYLIAQAVTAIALLSCAPAIAQSMLGAPDDEIVESSAARVGRGVVSDQVASEIGLVQASPEVEHFAESSISDAACLSNSECDCPNYPSLFHWYFQAEAVMLFRDRATETDRLSFNSGASTSVPVPSMGSGPQFTLGIDIDQNHGLEGRYFSIQGMNGMTTGRVTFSAQPLAPVGTDGVPTPYAGLTDFGDRVLPVQLQTNYQSDLRNAEVNYLYTQNAFSLLAGFRFVQWNEVFDLQSATRIESENNLYGGQLGGRWKASFRIVNAELTGRAGVFGNNAMADIWHIGVLPERDWTSASHASTTAFVGDINASVSIRLTQIWSVRTGYNLVWIDRIALAPDQASDNPNFHFATDGNVFLQGVNVGLEGQW